ncbi:MAG: SMC-Scp complex subunit ScpB [Verrucomicrobia bacterium]|nr:SMC-Scp complex subunit ScpB [Verrucomicrobiota bacterium]
MSEPQVIPELKEIVGAMMFASKGSVSVGQVRKVMKKAAEEGTGAVKDFGRVSEKQIEEAFAEFSRDLHEAKLGFNVAEVANGYRLENDAGCGVWLRTLLEKGKPSRLSRPSMETLAIIAYRQPCVRSEIEAVRGVAVDQILRNLLDMQLIRIIGRSELPGRPWLFGTTEKFLEHFGLKNLNDLPGIEELRRMEEQILKKEGISPQGTGEEEEGQLEFEADGESVTGTENTESEE